MRVTVSCFVLATLFTIETAVPIPVLARALCFVNIGTPVFDLLSTCQRFEGLSKRVLSVLYLCGFMNLLLNKRRFPFLWFCCYPKHNQGLHSALI